MFTYFWKREQKQGRGRDTESEAGPSTDPDTGLELKDCEIVTWAEVRHLTNWVTHVLQCFIFLFLKFIFRVCVCERERERKSQAGSVPSAKSPTWDLIP